MLVPHEVLLCLPICFTHCLAHHVEILVDRIDGCRVTTFSVFNHYLTFFGLLKFQLPWTLLFGQGGSY